MTVPANYGTEYSLCRSAVAEQSYVLIVSISMCMDVYMYLAWILNRPDAKALVISGWVCVYICISVYV